jgi:hypothetical protein
MKIKECFVFLWSCLEKHEAGLGSGLTDVKMLAYSSTLEDTAGFDSAISELEKLNASPLKLLPLGAGNARPDDRPTPNVNQISEHAPV